ncbi:hypothetical protein OIDMADRAFT_19591 [Oidiodendron maius Zn]|uniref:Uncharacterized protein n=1 Tax=Oidiodendron maius (strain Zn) TaxID=913774 RepID=A0A0C3HBT8_OIDMZ|nr:hypothetical protein OIDMADRAFT_19591 [Oidiodendron maius Zn]
MEWTDKLCSPGYQTRDLQKETCTNDTSIRQPKVRSGMRYSIPLTCSHCIPTVCGLFEVVVQ